MDLVELSNFIADLSRRNIEQRDEAFKRALMKTGNVATDPDHHLEKKSPMTVGESTGEAEVLRSIEVINKSNLSK